MEPSKYQMAVYSAVRDTNFNVAVEATAGSGKSTTLLECLNLIPRMKKSVFLSFSNTIVNELKERVPSHIKASTLHSLGCKMVMKRYKGVKIDEEKWFKKLAGDLRPDEKTKARFRECGQASEIINYARMTLTEFTVEDLTDMCDHYNLEYSEDTLEMAVKNLLTAQKVSSKIDFTDMIWLPATQSKFIDEQYDYIFLDEAQDLNNMQRVFLEKLLKPGGRLISVGDSKQSIYSFSGSSIDSFDRLKSRPNTTVLPLSISYRCAKSVVEKAREIYDSIEPFQGNEEGVVRRGDVDEIGEGDMVLCRKTAPLVVVFFNLLKRGIKSTIIGKDTESGLLDLAEKVQALTLDEIYRNIDKQKALLEEELMSRGFKHILTHSRYVALMDKIAVLNVIMKMYNDPGNLSQAIADLFSEDKKAVRLMTIHRSKGLENDRVFIIDIHNNERLMPSPYATKDWELVQERNIEFVAYTRAKKELVFIKTRE